MRRGTREITEVKFFFHVTDGRAVRAGERTIDSEADEGTRTGSIFTATSAYRHPFGN